MLEVLRDYKLRQLTGKSENVLIKPTIGKLYGRPLGDTNFTNPLNLMAQLKWEH
jgi:hypothetical protein